VLDRGISARGEEGAEISWGQGREIGETRRAAAVLGQEIEELYEIAAIGCDRVRRSPALGLQPTLPFGNRVSQIGLRGKTCRIEGRGAL